MAKSSILVKFEWDPEIDPGFTEHVDRRLADGDIPVVDRQGKLWWEIGPQDGQK
jgi:hypothetical protein